MIGEALPAGLGIDALGGFVRQASGGLALPGKFIRDADAAAGGAVISQQAVRHVQHDVTLVGLTGALLLQVLELEHQVVGEGAVQPEHRIGRRGEGGDDGAHQRDRAGAAGALLLIDRGLAADDVPPDFGGAGLLDDDAGLLELVGQERDQHPAARIERLNGEFLGLRGERQRRIGKAEVEALVAARHRRAGRQHHAAAVIEQVDQLVERLAAGERLGAARHREARGGLVVAGRGKRENGPVHGILLSNLPEERHTGQTKAASRGGLRTIGN